MSQSLRTLTDNKILNLPSPPVPDETNLERGQIFLFTPGYQNATSQPFCWIAPGTGTAVIEIWGASGSGSLMCCCGGGLPGNPGAYSSRTVTVTSSCFVCGTVGMSCGNTLTLAYRGRGESTGICWTGSGTNGCMCAEGGISGTAICSTGTNLFCCFAAANYCRTLLATNCGIICNIGTGAPAGCCAQAYGGTVNCFGGFSCASFRGADPSCICNFIYHVAVSPGVIARNGAMITYNVENENGFSAWSGQGFHAFAPALSAAGRSPTAGVSFTSCWSSNRSCGCYEQQGCNMYMPTGVPGLPPHPCSNVRDHAIRGGHGAVRIRFF